MDTLQISAKNLGQLALPHACPRCLWLKLRTRNRLPYSIFPGVFATIDRYTKDTVHGWFDRNGCPPSWLNGIGNIVGYKDPPRWSRFKLAFAEFGIVLTGEPDAVFVKADGSHVIADYKTAKYTANQDMLLPMYEVQLNVYALLGERLGLFTPVSGLALIYFEPITGALAVPDGNVKDHGFSMEFSTHILPVTIDTARVEQLLAQARQVFDLPQAPKGRMDCRDCSLREKMTRLFS